MKIIWHFTKSKIFKKSGIFTFKCGYGSGRCGRRGMSVKVLLFTRDSRCWQDRDNFHRFLVDWEWLRPYGLWFRDIDDTWSADEIHPLRIVHPCCKSLRYNMICRLRFEHDPHIEFQFYRTWTWNNLLPDMILYRGTRTEWTANWLAVQHFSGWTAKTNGH